MARSSAPHIPDQRLRLTGDQSQASDNFIAVPEASSANADVPGSNMAEPIKTASMDQILENLYLGNLEAAQDPALLASHGITHVLSLTSRHAAISLPADLFTHCWFHVDDHRSQNLLKFLLDSLAFVEEALLSTPTGTPPSDPSSSTNPPPTARPSKVFVHCRAGISRSASVVIAFVMKHDHQTFTQALATVKAKRPRINPNEGFRAQLSLLESCHFDLSGIGMDIAEMEVWNPYDGEEGWWKMDREKERERSRKKKRRLVKEKSYARMAEDGGMVEIGVSEPQRKILSGILKELEKRGDIKPKA